MRYASEGTNWFWRSSWLTVGSDLCHFRYARQMAVIVIRLVRTILLHVECSLVRAQVGQAMKGHDIVRSVILKIGPRCRRPPKPGTVGTSYTFY